MKCSVCGSENLEGSAYCEDCGARLPQGMPAVTQEAPAVPFAAPQPAPASLPAPVPESVPAPMPQPTPSAPVPGAEAVSGTVRCAACGAETRDSGGGWRRTCPACRAEHFPRVDPVVIMLPTFQGRCLLGRQAAWPAGRMSALAGFLEPGESIEEACAREVAEEAGLQVTAVRYHSSQPWPFPAQLMIGLICEVSHDRAAPDQTELEAVAWLTRDEARAVLENRHPAIRPPTPIAIARTLLTTWVDEEGS